MVHRSSVSYRRCPTFLLSVLIILCFASAKKSVSLIRSYDHDEQCFTQGLHIDGGTMYESCGGYGKSSVRIVDSSNGKVLKSRRIDREFFAEGLTVVGDHIYMLTWKRQTLFVFNKETLAEVTRKKYTTFNRQGWGIVFDGKHLIVSDGSEYLSYFEPPSNDREELKRVKQLRVTEGETKRSMSLLNELELVDGVIYANVWYKDFVLRIDAVTAEVISRIDLKALYPKRKRVKTADCLNGIAYNASDNSYTVTGKNWPKYYHIVIEDQSGRDTMPATSTSTTSISVDHPSTLTADGSTVDSTTSGRRAKNEELRRQILKSSVGGRTS